MVLIVVLTNIWRKHSSRRFYFKSCIDTLESPGRFSRFKKTIGNKVFVRYSMIQALIPKQPKSLLGKNETQEPSMHFVTPLVRLTSLGISFRIFSF